MESITATIMRADEDQRLRTKAQEGVRLTSYQDTQNPPHWAIGYGHDQSNPRPVRGLVNGEFYQGPTCAGLTITKAEADRLFDADIDEVERGISKAVTVELTQGQMNSCVDFCFHYGLEHFRQSTLLQKINFNPNNLEAILPQFARWNINAGRRDKAIYMRSCRRACVYAGVTIPQKLWEPNRFPWAVTDADQIDTSITPTVFELVEMGRNNVLPYKFDPSKPLPSPAPQETPPAPLPDSANDTLVLNQPAPIEIPAVASPAAGRGEGVSPPLATEAATEAEPLPRPSPPISLPPPPPKLAPILVPKTVDVRSIPYGEVAPENGVKNMTDSKRFIGMLIVGAGSLVQVLATRDVVTSAAGAIFFDLSRDPVIVALIAGGIAWSFGWIITHCGQKVITKGMTGAQHLLK